MEKQNLLSEFANIESISETVIEPTKATTIASPILQLVESRLHQYRRFSLIVLFLTILLTGGIPWGLHENVCELEHRRFFLACLVGSLSYGFNLGVRYIMDQGIANVSWREWCKEVFAIVFAIMLAGNTFGLLSTKCDKSAITKHA